MIRSGNKRVLRTSVQTSAVRTTLLRDTFFNAFPLTTNATSKGSECSCHPNDISAVHDNDHASMYDPTGKSRSRDPIGFKGSPWNLYEYVNSKPLISTDPLGLLGDPDPLPKTKPPIPKTKIVKNCVRIGGKAFLVVSVFVEGVLVGKWIGDECFPRIPVDSDRAPECKGNKTCIYSCRYIGPEACSTVFTISYKVNNCSRDCPSNIKIDVCNADPRGQAARDGGCDGKHSQRRCR
ncbi:hypothetical protein Q31b_49130 [Novipirellula aureliae]|uniref:RHS repeat-associated core domain protein n=1 Tax=Novipirellula aureliae TaxID=2527966 RepID=A0A5C6DJ65_9BACT|nr:hypothetical protein Q31b_49130 [Novipirellula aureliae]